MSKKLNRCSIPDLPCTLAVLLFGTAAIPLYAAEDYLNLAVGNYWKYYCWSYYGGEPAPREGAWIKTVEIVDTMGFGDTIGYLTKITSKDLAVLTIDDIGCTLSVGYEAMVQYSSTESTEVMQKEHGDTLSFAAGPGWASWGGGVQFVPRQIEEGDTLTPTNDTVRGHSFHVVPSPTAGPCSAVDSLKIGAGAVHTRRLQAAYDDSANDVPSTNARNLWFGAGVGYVSMDSRTRLQDWYGSVNFYSELLFAYGNRNDQSVKRFCHSQGFSPAAHSGAIRIFDLRGRALGSVSAPSRHTATGLFPSGGYIAVPCSRGGARRFAVP